MPRADRVRRYRAAVTVAGLWLAAIGLNRWSRRVTGSSMEPALRKGDVLVVLPRWVRWRVGDVVVARDPRLPSRELIKRVAAIVARNVDLRGDSPDHSTDSRTFGAVPATSIAGRVVRVWPPWRLRPSSHAPRCMRRAD